MSPCCRHEVHDVPESLGETGQRCIEKAAAPVAPACDGVKGDRSDELPEGKSLLPSVANIAPQLMMTRSRTRLGVLRIVCRYRQAT